MGNRRRTKNYFPEPRFQFRFIAYLVLGAGVQLAITCAILYHFLKENYTLLVRYSALDANIVALLRSELKFLAWVIGGTGFAYLVGLGFIGVLFSHRVGGVLYALKRTIREINEGKDSVLRLRKNDEFQEIQEAFNSMVRRLKAGSERKVG